MTEFTTNPLQCSLYQYRHFGCYIIYTILKVKTNTELFLHYLLSLSSRCFCFSVTYLSMFLGVISPVLGGGGGGGGYDSQWVNELSICIYLENVYQYNDYENCPLSLLKPKCVWRSIHYTYQTFLALRIWCTDHVCDSWGLTDVSILFRHRFRWLQYVNNWWPIVTWSMHESATCNCDVTMANCSYVVSLDVFLSLRSWRPRFEDFVNTLLC